MKFFFLSFMVNGTDQHTAGFDSHHCSGWQIRDGDAGLTDQLFRLVVSVDAGKDGTGDAGAVIQRELQKLLGLRNRFAFQHLHGAKIGF